MTSVKVKFVSVMGYPLINIRLWFYIVALVNLLITAYVSLSIDLTIEDDPKVRVYSKTRWLLVTCWFNMATIFYIILCIYCDWREKNGHQTPLLDQLTKIRDVIMTSLIMPVTAYSDTIFWVLYTTCPWIISPLRVLELLPYWTQHSLHTVSLCFVIIDLVLTPRRTPKNHKTNLAMLYGFSCFYTFVMYVSYTLGIPVYAFQETASRTVCILTFFGSLLIVTVYYYAQWLLIDCIWGQKVIRSSDKSNHVKLE